VNNKAVALVNKGDITDGCVLLHFVFKIRIVARHRRVNDFSIGGAKIERVFVWGSKNWWKTIETIKFKVQLNAIPVCICIFRKRYTQHSTTGSGAKSQKLGNFREFLC